MNNKLILKPWNLIAELTDKNVLGLDGMSNKAPRKTSRAIVINEDGNCAVMHETNQRKFLQARDLAALTEYCKRLELKSAWQSEEQIAHIHGWDFSHIYGRYEEGQDIPWDYEKIVRQYLNADVKILDYDTGGGEFLLSLNHPYNKTAATEGFPPNVELCKEKLLPLGIDFKECDDPANIPFADETFDIIINRHGDFNAKELYRLLKKGGLFITQQVGSENDRELVEFVLPGTPKPFPHLNLKEQRKVFEEAGFEILQAEEAYLPIKFYDVGAFVWFARIIEWEFPDFSVDNCFEQLLQMQKIVDEKGEIAGTTHRYLIVARRSI